MYECRWRSHDALPSARIEGFMGTAPLHPNATMSQTIEVRQQNPEQTENMAQYESPNEEAICASYVSRAVADQLGEFAALTITDEADVTAALSKTTANYAVYETAGGSVTGLYVNRDQFDGEEPPEEIGLEFDQSTEEAFEDAREAIEDEAEEEAEGLLASSDDADESEDDEVEISDEELDLTA